jgi:uncharacterized protein (DUF342 family)
VTLLTSQEAQAKDKIETKMSDLFHTLISQQNRSVWTQIEDERLQELLSTLIKIYATKVKTAGNDLIPVSKAELNETETAVFTDQLLKYMNIELFELQIWRSMGSNY